MAQRVVDLSLPLHNDMRGVTLEPARIMARDGLNTTHLHLYSHAGTHMDAPRHFVAGGYTIDRVDLHKCIGPALVIDLSHKTPNSLITIEDFQPHESKINSGFCYRIPSLFAKAMRLRDNRQFIFYVNQIVKKVKNERRSPSPTSSLQYLAQSSA